MRNSKFEACITLASFLHSSLRKIYHFKIKLFEVFITRIRRIYKIGNVGSLLQMLQHCCSIAKLAQHGLQPGQAAPQKATIPFQMFRSQALFQAPLSFLNINSLPKQASTSLCIQIHSRRWFRDQSAIYHKKVELI